MHSSVEATAGLCKHAACGRNDQPATGHCLALIPLFGQDSKNHIDPSSPGHSNKCTARQSCNPHLLGISLAMQRFPAPCCPNI